MIVSDQQKRPNKQHLLPHQQLHKSKHNNTVDRESLLQHKQPNYNKLIEYLLSYTILIPPVS